MENKNFKKLTKEAVRNNEVIQNFMKKDSHTVEEIETVLKEISTKRFLNMIEGVKGVIDMSETILKMDTIVMDYINEVMGEEEMNDYEKLLNDEKLKESKEKFLEGLKESEKEEFNFDEELNDSEMRSSFEFLEKFNLINKENLERFKETSKGADKEHMEELIKRGKLCNLTDDVKERINRQMNPLNKSSMMKIFNMGIIDREEVNNLLGFFSENLNTDFDYPKIKHFEKDLHKEEKKIETETIKQNKSNGNPVKPAFDFSHFNETKAVAIPVNEEIKTTGLVVYDVEFKEIPQEKEITRKSVIRRPGTTKVEEKQQPVVTNPVETNVNQNSGLFSGIKLSMFGCYN